MFVQRRVHWGRKITAAQVARAKYYTTRYPVGYTAPPAVKTVSLSYGGKEYKVVDIGEHWAKEHISSCVASGLLSPSGDPSYAYFRPNSSITRAQAVTALYRAKGCPKPKSEASFTDIIEDWYRDAVSWAVSEGIVSGVTEDTFDPYSPVKREQLALMLHRYAGCKDATADLSAFADAGEIAPFAESGVMWAVKSNILSGKDGLLLPKGEITRAEFCAAIIRLSHALVAA